MEGQRAAAGPQLVVPLREGGPLTLVEDIVSVPGVELPIFEIAWIGLAPDPGVPQLDEAPQMGIGVRTRDSGAYYFVPEQPADGKRMLDALFALRPALRDVPTPAGGAFSDQPRGALEGQPLTPEQPAIHALAAVPTSEERMLASLAHLSMAFLPIVLPLAFFLALRRSAPYAAEQAKQALGFQCVDAIVAVLMLLLVNAVTGLTGLANEVGFLVLALAGIALLVFAVSFSWAHAARRAFAGEPFHYPFLGWL